MPLSIPVSFLIPNITCVWALSFCLCDSWCDYESVLKCVCVSTEDCMRWYVVNNWKMSSGLGKAMWATVSLRGEYINVKQHSKRQRGDSQYEQIQVHTLRLFSWYWTGQLSPESLLLVSMVDIISRKYWNVHKESIHFLYFCMTLKLSGGNMGKIMEDAWDMEHCL